MRSLWIGLTAIGAAAPAMIWALNVSTRTVPSASAALAPARLECGFDTYEALDRYAALSANERRYYTLGMGYANTGTLAQHEQLREAFTELSFNPDRTPIVMADLVGGKLYTHYCEAERCSRAEIASEAPSACMRETGAEQCLTFAVRVDKTFYCTIGPRFKNG